MSNVLTEDKRQQVLALGRLGWSLRRIERATGVRRETASNYLKAAGVMVRGRGRPRTSPSKPAISSEVSTDSSRAPSPGTGLVGRTRQPAQAPPSSPLMVWECGPVALGSASRRIAARSSAVEYSSGKASIGARMGSVWRQRGAGARSLLCSRPRSPSSRGRRLQGGGGSRAPVCSPPVVRGSPWACRQAGWAGGSKEPPARGGGGCPRTVV